MFTPYDSDHNILEAGDRVRRTGPNVRGVGVVGKIWENDPDCQAFVIWGPARGDVTWEVTRHLHKVTD